MFGFGGGGPPEKEENELYEILGVPRTATQQQIKTAFRKAAMQHHPDKGGDVEQYKKINTANEILSDPEKRALYDKYGMEGLRDGGGRGGGGPADIFDLFGMGGGRRGGGGGPQGKRKGEDVVFPLKVTLDELYTGTEKKLRLTKNIICAACNGAGGKGEPKPCAPCKGRGMRIIIRQIGPGMIQQMQTVCDACSGTGQTIDPKDRCTTCEGAKTVKEKKTLTVYVNRGQRHGERIVFRGEADEAPDTVPGNVVVVLQQKEHDVFTRRGEDLIVRHTISLSEALCGFSFQLKHLDERVLVVKSAPGAIYKPGDVKNIPNEGMPSSKNQFNRGNLYIEFNVEFPKPEELTPEAVAQLARLLPPGPNNASTTMLPDEHEVVGLVDVNLDDLRRSEEEAQQRAQQEAYDEDEEGGGHPQGGCRQG